MNTLSFIELLRGQPLTDSEKAKVLDDLRGGSEAARPVEEDSPKGQ
jgi:hypothetical protein